MTVALADPVEYGLPVDDASLALNTGIGGNLRIDYQGEINCVSCGRKTSKSYAQGHCYPCFISLAECDMCILRPETCHFAAGTCRQPDWGLAHCMQPHYVYLANSSGIKVGITRASQIPTRWIDQGASQALPIFRVASRYQSGLLEVAIKKHVADRTDWRKMLRGDPEPVDLESLRNELADRCEAETSRLKQDFGEHEIEFLPAETVTEIHYPVIEYPQKIRSFNLLKQARIEGALLGIKGQYLILDTGVLNVRNHSGYKIDIHLN